MVNIDDVYQKVLVLANKEQRGYITPQEFNLFANQAQREIFEQYFYDLNQFSRIHGDSGEYSDTVHNINEKIAIFERPSGFTGGSFDGVASNLYRLGTVIYDHATLGSIEVEEVQQNEVLYINASPLTRPTLNKPVYVRTGDATISVFPTAITNVDCTYVQAPAAPEWGYFVIGNKALHDSSLTKTTHFQLHQSEESELVYKILKLAGITMKSPEVVQVGQTLEQSQIQQEKQ
jgi:hypothetical protein